MSKQEIPKRPPRKITGIVIALFALNSLSAPMIQWAFKDGWVFIDHEVKLNGLARTIFFLMIVNALLSLYALTRRLAGWRSKTGNIAMKFLFPLSAFLGLVFQLVNFFGATTARTAALAQTIGGTLLWSGALLGVPFLLLAWPNIKLKSAVKTAISGALAIAFAVAMVIFLLNPGKPRLVAGPVVFDTGTGNYSIVFATNKDTQGFVRYALGGEEKEVYSTDTVVRRIGKIHAVRVPREELENNRYSFGVREVRYGPMSYTGAFNTGRTVPLGGPVEFKGARDIEHPNILAVTDWHEENAVMQRAVEAFDVIPDFVLLLGDYADYYFSETDIMTALIDGASRAAFGGSIPAIIARANHEVRGNFMGQQRMYQLLGLPGFYYEVERGGYIFTVLDSAENSEWEHDAWEHVNQYEAAGYFSRQLDWLESLTPGEEKQRIIVVHDCKFTSEETLQARFRAALLALGVNVMVSGHSHNYEIISPEWANGTITQFFAGGRGGVAGTGWSLPAPLPPLKVIKGQAAFTAALLNFGKDEILMRGMRTEGLSGSVSEMQTYAISSFKEPI